MKLRNIFVGVVIGMASLPAFAQQGLGMEISGDDDAAFGLLISNWMDDRNAPFLAPGMIEPRLEPLSRKQVDARLRVEDALRSLPANGP